MATAADMAHDLISVAQSRKYLVKSVADAKAISTAWLEDISLAQAIQFGLPEVDDRYHIWRIPLKAKSNREPVGEIVVDAYRAEVMFERTTRPELIEARLLNKPNAKSSRKVKQAYTLSSLRSTIGFGDCTALIEDMPAASVDLIFTSPPYFNARPQYSEYEEYQHYLDFMRLVIRRSHRVLAEGRFFVMNSSPILLRRASRSEASRRIAVPFDLHAIFIEEGYEFIDDIIWVKPEGAGWATGRGRRFAADRNPLQYKAVPVTEYVMVYRKRSDQLIDWHIRNHPNRALVRESRIVDGYEKTNIWRIQPNTRSRHPAPFPLELAEKVIRYYSFKGDVVMDPFAGSGTTGKAAATLDRRFVLYDNNREYVNWICQAAMEWTGPRFEQVLLQNCADFPRNGQRNLV